MSWPWDRCLPVRNPYRYWKISTFWEFRLFNWYTRHFLHTFVLRFFGFLKGKRGTSSHTNCSLEIQLMPLVAKIESFSFVWVENSNDLMWTETEEPCNIYFFEWHYGEMLFKRMRLVVASNLRSFRVIYSIAKMHSKMYKVWWYHYVEIFFLNGCRK